MKVKTKLLGIISILVVSIIGIGGSSVFMISSTVKKNEELKDKMEFQKGVQSGKCGFTTLSPFPRLFPQF
ncbi:hypothetical protein CJZ71_00655 [Bacillus subtilis]|nr:hypothetical protein A4A60_10720 [Bacillus subtilis]ARW31719.1 Putative methyl-accepting chemotaxis protein YoaH [Bacillus subtilis subsp. subtilis]ASB70045.1 Putative methyl-accepting chemotaxis protein YoaH [Bacillus subtilis subsp. subtilis]ASV00822.1 hypothetical protein CJZ71_00655 [Bacillus subtilis]AYK57080.1 hypothetical protein D9C10_07735 [Bacillus subtilis subsp. subtilis]